MKTSANKLTLRYAPKLWSTVIFFLLLIFVYGLFQGRKEGFFRFDFVNGLLPDYYLHISNFSISYLLYAGIGYMWLMAGVELKHIALFGVLIILANLAYELWLPLLNTKDTTDAYYGIGGTVVGFVFLWLVKKHGLKLNVAE